MKIKHDTMSVQYFFKNLTVVKIAYDNLTVV